jgi:hypothetical protein
MSTCKVVLVLEGFERGDPHRSILLKWMVSIDSSCQGGDSSCKVIFPVRTSMPEVSCGKLKFLATMKIIASRI